MIEEAIRISSQVNLRTLAVVVILTSLLWVSSFDFLLQTDSGPAVSTFPSPVLSSRGSATKLLPLAMSQSGASSGTALKVPPPEILELEGPTYGFMPFTASYTADLKGNLTATKFEWAFWQGPLGGNTTGPNPEYLQSDSPTVSFTWTHYYLGAANLVTVSAFFGPDPPYWSGNQTMGATLLVWVIPPQQTCNTANGGLTFVASPTSPVVGYSPLTVSFSFNVSGGTPPYSYHTDSWLGGNDSLLSSITFAPHPDQSPVEFTVRDARGYSVQCYFTIAEAEPMYTITDVGDQPSAGPPPLTFKAWLTVTDMDLYYADSVCWAPGYPGNCPTELPTPRCQPSPGQCQILPGTFEHNYTFPSALAAVEAAYVDTGWHSGLSTIGFFCAVDGLQVNITATSSPGPTALHVVFTSTPRNGVPTYNYTWNFGDGSAVSHMPNPAHNFTTPGSYGVSLDIVDGLGFSAEASLSVAFPANTNNQLICQPSSVNINQPSTCTATVTDVSSSPTSPTGSVNFTTDSTGSFSPSDGTCNLAETVAGTASCFVRYSPSVGGDHLLIGTYNGDSSHARSSSSFDLATGCGDERDSIIQEYKDYNLGWIPTCTDFTQTAHSEHFSFQELNTGDYSWAIIRDSLLTGLENTRSNFGKPMTITSSYRNPAKNAAIQGAAPKSRHMFGDAADVYAGDCSTWNALSKAAHDAGAWVEPLATSNNDVAHVHMDWAPAGIHPPSWSDLQLDSNCLVPNPTPPLWNSFWNSLLGFLNNWALYAGIGAVGAGVGLVGLLSRLRRRSL